MRIAPEFPVPSRTRDFSCVGKVACMDRPSIASAECHGYFSLACTSCRRMDTGRPLAPEPEPEAN